MKRLIPTFLTLLIISLSPMLRSNAGGTGRSDRMPMAKRCSTCGLDFPNLSAFTTCPKCEGKLDRITNGKPMTQLEANHLIAEFKFERFYADYDKRRNGPSPEEVGVAEAKKLAHEWRMLEAQLGQG